MTDDFADRMRALPPTLPDVPDRVERVHRLVSRRRRRQVGIAAVATALAVVIPVALVSGLPSGGNRHAEQHLPTTSLATVAHDCPAQGLSITALSASARMTHTAAQVRTAIAQQHTGGHIVGIYPALVKDPFASKLGLGSATVRRRMWVVYTVRTTGPERSASGPGPSPALIASEHQNCAAHTCRRRHPASGGDLGCKPISAVRGNVGYGIAAGAQVGGTGTIGPAGSGFVLCFIGVPFRRSAARAPARRQRVRTRSRCPVTPTRWRTGQAGNRYVRGTWQEGGLRVSSIGAPQAGAHSASPHNPPCRPQLAVGPTCLRRRPQRELRGLRALPTAAPGVAVGIGSSTQPAHPGDDHRVHQPSRHQDQLSPRPTPPALRRPQPLHRGPGSCGQPPCQPGVPGGSTAGCVRTRAGCHLARPGQRRHHCLQRPADLPPGAVAAAAWHAADPVLAAHAVCTTELSRSMPVGRTGPLVGGLGRRREVSRCCYPTGTMGRAGSLDGGHVRSTRPTATSNASRSSPSSGYRLPSSPATPRGRESCLPALLPFGCSSG